MSEPRAINCTNCGAPLELKGGHRVRSLTCSYCGSVMDTHEGYRKVAEFKDIPRPDTPFEIGLKGVIDGVNFTVIGMLGYELVEDGVIYKWVSSQLFSPTHGYAWITYNRGHVVFSRRVRELPEPRLPSAKRKKRVEFRGETYRIFESYVAYVDYAEGELTWIAKRNDQVSVTEAINPPWLLEYEISQNELEYGLGRYLSRDEAEKAFNLDKRLPRGENVHPAQPFVPSPFLVSLSHVGQIFCGVAAVGFVLWAFFGTGTPIVNERIDFPAQSSSTLSFSVADADDLIEINLEAPVSNSWIYVEATVSDQEKPLMTIGREIGYYFGREGGENWTEGSRSQSARFRVPQAGDYELEVEAEAEYRGIDWLQVQLREGVMPIRYLIALLVISVFSAVLLTITRLGFETRRWKQEDEDDDD